MTRRCRALDVTIGAVGATGVRVLGSQFGKRNASDENRKNRKNRTNETEKLACGLKCVVS
jgi:hypothetical protein